MKSRGGLSVAVGLMCLGEVGSDSGLVMCRGAACWQFWALMFCRRFSGKFFDSMCLKPLPWILLFLSRWFLISKNEFFVSF